MLVSIVLRTLNEAANLGRLLDAINTQAYAPDWEVETVVVDSGSSDQTLAIAQQYGARITHIAPEEFTFGRALNIGCAFADGDYLVFVSGHCIPANDIWLAQLVQPLVRGACSYAYGHQLGDEQSKFSEQRVLDKYFPPFNMVPQRGFFANNANAALPRSVWRQHSFDESLTGLEDMHLAKRLVEAGHQVGYVRDASVYHLHNERWPQVLHRYRREGEALRHIIPDAQLGFSDFCKFTLQSIVADCRAAHAQRVLRNKWAEIGTFRLLQYWGAFLGTGSSLLGGSEASRRYYRPDRYFDEAALQRSGPRLGLARCATRVNGS